MVMPQEVGEEGGRMSMSSEQPTEDLEPGVDQEDDEETPSGQAELDAGRQRRQRRPPVWAEDYEMF